MLNQDFREMLQTLSEEKVDFIVIGAYAMAAQGIVRATGDIDIWYDPTSENATKLYQALIKFGAPVKDLSPEDFCQPATVFQIGVVPCRIDLLSEIDGLEFAAAKKNALNIEISKCSFLVLSAPDLIKNKKATGRTRDLADIEELEKILTRT